MLWASCMFFFSLLSRENGIFVPFWLASGYLLFFNKQNDSWLLLFKKALLATVPFFIALASYMGLRLWAFGFGSLPRTITNLWLRLKLFTGANTVHLVQENAITLPGQSALASPAATSWLMLLEKKFFSWLSPLLMMSPVKQYDKLFMLFLTIVILYILIKAYKKEKALFCFLLIGIALNCWPGFVAYPCPRYLSTIYPIIAFMISYALYLLYKRYKRHRISAAILLMISIGFLVRGTATNRYTIYRETHERLLYKQRFDKLFSGFTLPKDCSLVVVLSSPFVSDIQSIFHYYTKNYTLAVAHEPFATLAEQGSFGCRQAYRCIGVSSKIIPIPGGYRLVSEEQNACCWRLHFSDYPLAWSEKDRAYEWQEKPYLSDQWYNCSIGRFKINKRLDDACISDMSFFIDQRWLGPGTVFIAWDTMAGCYTQLDSHHLR